MLEEIQAIEKSVYDRPAFAEQRLPRAGKGLEAFTVSLCDSEEAFRALQPEWNALLDHAARKSAFLRHEFMFTWWTNYGRQQRGATLFILLARDRERRLVGVLPLYREKSRWPVIGVRELRFLGSVHEAPEYLDVIAADNALTAKIVATLLAGLANLRAQYDLLRLADMAEDALLLSFLPSWTDSHGGQLYQWPWMVCPHIKITGDFESYLKTVSSNHRANFRRQQRKLNESHQVTMDVATTPAQVENDFEKLFALHHQRWAGRQETSAFDNAISHAFHRELVKKMAANDVVRIFSLKCDGQIVANLYGYFYDNRLLYYQAGFDLAFESKSVGLILMGLVLQYCFAHGYSEFDFLRGLEEYKFRWTKATRATVACEIALNVHAKFYLRGLHALRNFKKRLRDLHKNLQAGAAPKITKGETT